jgi:hypothetical protein
MLGCFYRRWTVSGVFSLIFSGAALGAGETETAESLVRRSGVKGGLIVHVGCGNGEKTAAYRLGASPVFDGFAACDTGLYLSTVGGRVLRYQPRT